MKHTVLLFLFLIVVGAGSYAFARMFRVNQVPNGDVKQCLTCHVTPGGDRNAFGREVGRNHLSTPGSTGNVQWSATLAALDSDGDGFTNGQELQDPQGQWAIGQPMPGDRTRVTNPGDPTDFPNTTEVQLLHAAVADFALHANYPNPFNPSTTITFTVATPSRANIRVYSLTGELVRTIVDEQLQPGNYSARWNGRDDNGSLVESGTYLYHMTAGKFSSTRRMVLVK